MTIQLVDARNILLAFERIHRRINEERISRLAPLQLTPPQARVLLTLAKGQPMSLKDLGEQLPIEVPPSRQIDVLVKRGLIQRAAALDDRRRITLTLTNAGDQLTEQIRRKETALARWLTKRLSNTTTKAVMKASTALAPNKQSR